MEEYLEKVHENADDIWREKARRVIRAVASTKEEFTADDVWDHLPPCREPRALGAMLRMACVDGTIEPTADYVKSRRRECHHRPLMVWRSKIIDKAAKCDLLPDEYSCRREDMFVWGGE